MYLDFLSPVDSSVLNEIDSLSSQHLGSKVVFHTKDDFPNLDTIKIAIIGIIENRGDSKQVHDVNLNYVRKELYSLFPGNWEASIADLGDIKAGATLSDTYFAVQQVASGLIKKKIIPIYIGGTQDLTYALYRSYDKLDQMVNLVAVDHKFNFGKHEDPISSTSYLSKIVADEPANLFNYSNIGYQTYYNSQEEIDLVDKLFFDAFRLGEVSNNLAIAEPVFRDADIVSVNLSSISSSASANTICFQPNGFDGKEICALSRYAGISDKVTMFGIFNHQNSANEAFLISQIIWYFIDGFHYRSKEYPFGTKENYIRYIVPFEEEDLVFYKSNKTDRWWLEVSNNFLLSNKKTNNTLLPCSYEEYLSACNQELPERWWRFQRKSII